MVTNKCLAIHNILLIAFRGLEGEGGAGSVCGRVVLGLDRNHCSG